MDNIATNTVRIVRTFDAAPGRVFDAWTDAEQFKAWMCPPGAGLDHCELDPRPGGAWFVRGFAPDGSRFEKGGVYVEVKRPERLVFTWPYRLQDGCTGGEGRDTTVDITFRAVGRRTEVTLVHGPFTDASGFNNHDDGWKGSLDKLAAWLAG
mgnify:CR=1 FL=1